jgi:hypothetical protein
MANSFFFMSATWGGVFDVTWASTTPNTALQIWAQKTPASNNQLWTFEQAKADPGYFFIKSELGHNLVIDAVKKGATLQSNPQNSNDSQLWRLGSVFGAVNGWVTIQSRLDQVIGLAGEKTTKGTQIEIGPLQSDNPTQFWFLFPGSSKNSYKPKITAIVPTAGGFTITGADFQPATQVIGRYLFDDPTTAYGGDSGAFVATTDLGGGFVSNNPASSLALTSSGLLGLQIGSFPGLPAGGKVSASWDGTTFTIKKWRSWSLPASS